MSKPSKADTGRSASALEAPSAAFEITSTAEYETRRAELAAHHVAAKDEVGRVAYRFELGKATLEDIEKAQKDASALEARIAALDHHWRTLIEEDEREKREAGIKVRREAAENVDLALRTRAAAASNIDKHIAELAGNFAVLAAQNRVIIDNAKKYISQEEVKGLAYHDLNARHLADETVIAGLLKSWGINLIAVNPPQFQEGNFQQHIERKNAQLRRTCRYYEEA